eukprot:10126550-Alexandrium_andersonii.AAC.1
MYAMKHDDSTGGRRPSARRTRSAIAAFPPVLSLTLACGCGRTCRTRRAPAASLPCGVAARSRS